jgi:hypothetical protein
MSLVTSTPTKLTAERGRPRPQQGTDGDDDEEDLDGDGLLNEECRKHGTESFS